MSNSAVVAQALRRVRDSEPGQAPQDALNIIEKAIGELWQRIRARPDSYIMTRSEFALFNYFRARYSQGANDSIARRAITRYWDQEALLNGA